MTGWHHEEPPTEQIPAFLCPGGWIDEAGYVHENQPRPRSIFVPVFWAVLCALVAFTTLAGAVLVIVLDQSVAGP